MLSIRDVSNRLGISRSLVYAEIHAGNLLAHRFGKRTYRVSEEDLSAYIEQHGHVALLPREVTSSSKAPAAPTGFKHLKVTQQPLLQNQPSAAGPGGGTAPSLK